MVSDGVVGPGFGAVVLVVVSGGTVEVVVGMFWLSGSPDVVDVVDSHPGSFSTSHGLVVVVVPHGLVVLVAGFSGRSQGADVVVVGSDGSVVGGSVVVGPGIVVVGPTAVVGTGSVVGLAVVSGWVVEGVVVVGPELGVGMVVLGAVDGPYGSVVVVLWIVFGVPTVGAGSVEVGAQMVVVDRSVVLVVVCPVVTELAGSVVSVEVVVLEVMTVVGSAWSSIELAALVAAISNRTSFAR